MKSEDSCSYSDKLQIIIGIECINYAANSFVVGFLLPDHYENELIISKQPWHQQV